VRANRGRLGFGGELGAVRQARRGDRVIRIGPFAIAFDPGTALLPGHLMFASHLRADDLGSGVVTTAGVTLLAADWTNTTATLKLSNYHDSGTGTTAEAVGQTTLVTGTGNTRVAGTQTNPSGGQYRSQATLGYTATAAITEWGLFTASSGGTLWDRRVFTAINVVNTDSIQFTYTLTCTAGG
jgi:hypothetical protein